MWWPWCVAVCMCGVHGSSALVRRAFVAYGVVSVVRRCMASTALRLSFAVHAWHAILMCRGIPRFLAMKRLMMIVMLMWRCGCCSGSKGEQEEGSIPKTHLTSTLQRSQGCWLGRGGGRASLATRP